MGTLYEAIILCLEKTQKLAVTGDRMHAVLATIYMLLKNHSLSTVWVCYSLATVHCLRDRYSYVL